jgi:hypothetical protein
MIKVSNLFAIAATLMLVLGLVSNHVPNCAGLSFPIGKARYGFPLQMYCNAFAALFCLFSFVYSIGFIRFGRTISLWHFWVSASTVLVLAIAIAVWVRHVPADAGGDLGTTGAILALSALASLPIFVLAQLGFCAEFIRALAHLRSVQR